MAASMPPTCHRKAVKALFFKAVKLSLRSLRWKCGGNRRPFPSGKGGLAEGKKLGYQVINQTFCVAEVW